MTKGRLVLVPFPFDHLETLKVRPALCLTDPIGSHRHVVLAFVSSRAPEAALDTDLFLDASSPDFPSTGLRSSSTIRLHRLMTVAASFIARELGELPAPTMREVETRLRKLFGLA